ncbi:hypothetical protein [Geomicrobium sp. JCM 19039]|nr:hypothetical protein [Geomicrobium sp. JCM 19039]
MVEYQRRYLTKMALPERADLVYESRQFQQTEQLRNEVAQFFYNPDT